jgi:hypothetical protein
MRDGETESLKRERATLLCDSVHNYHFTRVQYCVRVSGRDSTRLATRRLSGRPAGPAGPVGCAVRVGWRVVRRNGGVYYADFTLALHISYSA